jgi:hypothetical protein
LDRSALRISRPPPDQSQPSTLRSPPGRSPHPSRQPRRIGSRRPGGSLRIVTPLIGGVTIRDPCCRCAGHDKQPHRAAGTGDGRAGHRGSGTLGTR